MKEELDKALCEKYPKIFRDRHGDMQTTCMCWGLAIGDGWYNLIDTLCHQIQSHIDHSAESHERQTKRNKLILDCKDGDWTEFNAAHSNSKPEVIEYYRKIILNETVRTPMPIVEQVIADQVKEKFGGLRFYYHGGDEYIDGCVSLTESLSYCTCEICGAPGKNRGSNWIQTLCDTHAEKPVVS